jgi:crossover junction endodeoxyribonuclease RusA
MTLEFRVNGIAQQAGSKRAFVPKGWTRPVLTDSNRNLKSWQQLVADQASHAIEDLPMNDRALLLDGVRLTVAFFLPRPKSLPKRVTCHTKTPDLDKALRAIGDSLSGVCYRDDSQIVEIVAMKRYAAPAAVPHVWIRVEPSAGVLTLASDQPLFQTASDRLTLEGA